MKNYSNLLFDLDGTIIDPKEGITNSVKFALTYFGIEIPRTEELYKFIGPPLRESFSKYYKLNEAETEIAVKKYREFFRETGMYQNELYPGIKEMLANLYSENKSLILATSKAEIFAKKIIENLGLGEYFNYICGSTLDGSRAKKGEIIRYILDETGIQVNKTVMIGDKSHDVIGAKSNKVASIGVLYGYGDYEELQHAGATYIVRDIPELSQCLLENKKEMMNIER